MAFWRKLWVIAFRDLGRNRRRYWADHAGGGAGIGLIDPDERFNCRDI